MDVRNYVREFVPQFAEQPCAFYSQPLEWNTLAAGAVRDAKTFTVDSGYAFLATSVVCFIATTAAGAAEHLPWQCTVEASDSSGAGSWFGEGGATMHLANFAGRQAFDGNGPNFLTYPRLLNGATVVTVRLTNLEAVLRRVWMAINGVRIG